MQSTGSQGLLWPPDLWSVSGEFSASFKDRKIWSAKDLFEKCSCITQESVHASGLLANYQGALDHNRHNPPKALGPCVCLWQSDKGTASWFVFPCFSMFFRFCGMLCDNLWPAASNEDALPQVTWVYSVCVCAHKQPLFQPFALLRRDFIQPLFQLNKNKLKPEYNRIHISSKNSTALKRRMRRAVKVWEELRHVETSREDVRRFEKRWEAKK